MTITVHLLLFLFLKDIYLFLERGEGRERNINVWLPLKCPLLGTWPATQACALTGNGTLLHRPALNPLSHSSQGCFCFLMAQYGKCQNSAFSQLFLTEIYHMDFYYFYFSFFFSFLIWF